MTALTGLSLAGCQTLNTSGFGAASPAPDKSGFRAAVAADTPKAVAAARATLTSGGRAADAAAAMGLAVAAAMPGQPAGACVVHDGEDLTNFSIDFISGPDKSGRALGGMRAIHARWGKLPWTAIAAAAGAEPHVGADSPPPVTTPAVPGPPIGASRPMFANIPAGVVASDVLLGMEQQYFIVASPPDRIHMLADATYRALLAQKNGLKDPPPGALLRGKTLMQGYSHKNPTAGQPVNPPDALRPSGQSFVIVDQLGYAVACSFAASGGVLGAAPAVMLDVTDRPAGVVAATGRGAAPALAQIITSLGQEEFPLDDALERPRVNADGGLAELEPDAGDSAYALEERGWRMSKRADLARIAAVWKFEDGWKAMADPRGKGAAATFSGPNLAGTIVAATGAALQQPHSTLTPAAHAPAPVAAPAHAPVAAPVVPAAAPVAPAKPAATKPAAASGWLPAR